MLCKFGFEEYYTFDFVFKTFFGRLVLLLHLAFILISVMPEFYICRRLFIDISKNRNFVTTRLYIQNNFIKIYTRSLYTSLVTGMLKIIAATPIAIGVYEIYYWGWVCKLDELTSIGLFCFMLSLGFTFVWTGVFLHYCVSLSLTNYIMTLNPRANIFDACDLSVKLMEGKHERYVRFVFSFLKFIPLLLFVYPVFVLVPYYVFSRLTFIEDIMGIYWQDKMPAMIQRWKKHAG